MTQTANLQIVIAADSSKAQPALQQTAQATQAVGTAAEQSSRQLSGMQQTSQQTTQAQTAFLAGLKDQAATYGKSTEEVLRYRAAQLGVADAAEQHIAALARMRQAQGQGTISAGQMAQAMRMLPVQMTDVAVSLASGMPVWMVAIQQGGQLKDSFGGVGAAAKAVGGYVLGMINPLTVAGAALLAVGYASYAGAKEQTALAHSLVLTGSQSGATTAQLSNMAQAMGELDGVTRGGATAALTEFVGMNATGVESLQRFTTAAMAFERAGGGSVQEVAKQFKALGDDPLKAALKLNDGINFLTVSTYEQIKSLESQGKKTEAAKVAQEAYAAALEQRTPELISNLGLIERGWLAIKSATAGAGDAMLGIGRARDPLTQAKEELAKLQENQAGARSDNKEKYQPAIDALSRQLLMIDKVATAESERAKSKAEELRSVKDKAEWDKQSAEFVDKRGKRDQELIAAAVKGRELINKGLLTETELKDRLLGITEKYKEAEKKGAKPKSTANEFAAEQEAAKKWADTLTDLQRIQVDGEAATQNYTKAQQRLLQWFADPLFAQASDAQKELALAAFEAAHAFEIQQQAIKKQAQAMAEAHKAAAAYGAQLDRIALADVDVIEMASSYAESVAATVRYTELEASLSGATASQRAIVIKQYQIELDVQRQILAVKQKMASAEEEADAIAKIRAAGNKAKLNATTQVANEEAAKLGQTVENALTDGLMRGFENGKTIAANTRDVINNLLKTIVVRPAISAMMTPVAQGVSSVFGGGAGSGGMNMLGTASSLYSLYGAAGQAGGFIGSLGSSMSYGTAIGSQQGAMLAAQEMGMGTVAGNAASLGSALPMIGAAVAVIALLASLDDSGTPHMGGAALADSISGVKAVESATIGFGLAASDVSDKVVSSSKQIAKSAVSLLQNLDALTGKKSNWSVATAFADDSSKDGAWGALRITRDNEKVLDWNDTRQSKWAPKEFADGEAGAKQYGDAVAAGIKQAIDTIELPKWAANIVKNLGDSPTLEEMSAAMAEIQAMPEQALQAIGTSSL